VNESQRARLGLPPDQAAAIVRRLPVDGASQGDQSGSEAACRANDYSAFVTMSS